MKWRALAAIASCAVAGPALADPPSAAHDFAEEARALYRVAACGGDAPIPAYLDRPVVEANCAILKGESALFKSRWVDRARPFLGKLKPPGLPARAVYPFGGGDLIAALVTFPDATEVTTLSLEPAGDPRPIDAIKSESLAASLAINRGKMVRLFHVGHSRTSDLSRVSRHNRLPGELIYALTGLAILGYEPVSLRYFRLEKDGTLHYFTDGEIAAADASGEPREVHILFSNMELQFRPIGRDGPIRIHRHIGADLDDNHLGADPKVLRYLEARGPVVVMTKAASFLLWWDDFSIFRGYLLKNMEWMVSDSTGIPPHLARAAGFSQETYGQFEGTLLPKVGKRETEEFRELWASQPRRALPFRFGYPDSAKHPHLVVTFKKAAPAVIARALFGALLCFAATAGAEKELLLDGTHWRLATEHGPVHVWRPARYDRKSAGVVIYLHGWYDDADQAFANHHLAQQFEASEQNALFLVPEAPSSGEEATQWPVLEELLSTVLSRLKTTMPPGPLIVVGHSGAYRVIVSWLGDARVQHVILVDALYGSEEEFGAWIDAAASSASAATTPLPPQHRLTIVGGKSTRKWAEPFVAQRSYAVTRKELPGEAAELTPRERSARLLYLRTEVGHMELITDGKVLPLLLHRTALRKLAPPKTP